MAYMKRFLALFSILFSMISFGQVQIYSLDFETAGGYTTSTLEFSDGSEDYFTRTDGSNIASAMSFSNIQGNWFFAAHDIDGEGAASNQTLTIEDIDISGYSSLELRVYIAEDDDGVSQDWDDADFVHFRVDFDNAGSPSDILNIEGDGSSGTALNHEPAVDTDFDGVGDGTVITDAFALLTASITGTGNLLDVIVAFDLNSGDEDVAIDNIEIWGVAAVPDPEPSEQPTALMVDRTACNGLEASFTDAGGAQVPTGYLLIASDGAITPPVDGTDPVDDTDLSDGDAVVHITHGSGGTYNFAGLNSSTSYNFQVWSYTNGGVNVDFLTSPAGPTATETTLLPLGAEDFSTCPPNNQAENFDNSAGAAATTTWECANGYLEGNAFGNGNGTGAESWYILNGFNLDQSTNEVFSFNSYTTFTDGVPGLTVKYSTNYSGSGDPDNAVWTDLNPNLPAANSSVWTPSGLMDISSLSGTVYIAFVYESTANGPGASTRWRIDDIEICGVSTCVTPTSAMNVSALEGNAEAEVSWTNPSCFDEVIIVAHTSSIGGVPAGSYTANSNDYTDGANPAFPGGGVVVYNGTFSPQTITGLTNGQTYYFKIFSTRLGAWSSGVEVSATPILPPDGLQVNQDQKFYGSGFDETTLGMNRGQFDGSGISNPSPGQLSSLGWRFEGFSDGDSNYGDVITSGDYARGTSTGGVSTGGMYAFQRTVAGSVNHFMGFQPTGSDFTEGSAILRVQNQTGGDLRNIEVNFLILEYNDQARSQEIKFYYSTDDATWTEVSSVAHYTGLSADPSPNWEAFQKKAVIYDLNVADGDYIYFRWGSDDFDGSGSRDEIGFDNIVFKANFWSGTGTPNCDGCGSNP